MTTPTDDLAQALRELIPYAAECAACPGYRIKNARAALQAHESRANAASEEHECAYENGDGVCRECQALAAQTKAQPASVAKDVSEVLHEAELMLNKYKRLLQWDSHEWHHAEAVRSRVARAAAPQPPQGKQ